MVQNKRGATELVPIAEAAAILGVSVDTVRRWERGGKLKAHRSPGGHRLFSKTDLNAFKQDQGFSISEAAARLEVSTSTLRRWEREGKVTAERNEKGERVFTQQQLNLLEDGEAASFPSSYPVLSYDKTNNDILVPKVQSLSNHSSVTLAPSPSKIREDLGLPKEKIRFKGLAFGLTVLLLLLSGVTTAGVKYFGVKNGGGREARSNSNTLAVLPGIGETERARGRVLALVTEDEDRFFQVNIPAFFESGLNTTEIFTERLRAIPGLTVIDAQGTSIDFGTGTIEASNLVYSLQGQRGDVTLTAGEGIVIDGTTISATDSDVSLTNAGDITITETSDGIFTLALESTIDSVATINLSGTGTINGLDAIDDTSETTLEGALDIAGDVAGTGLGSVTIQANAVALATDTTGNYVATIADAGNSTITVANSGSENAGVTLDVIDVNCTDCLTATEIADVYVLNTGDTVTGLIDIALDNATNDGVTDSLRLTHTTSGSSAAGIGAGLAYFIEDAGGSEEQASIDAVLTTVTDSSEVSDIVFSVQQAGNIAEIARFDGSADVLDISGGITAAGTATLNGNTVIGNANSDTFTINAGEDGAGITFADASFQSCVLETDSSGVLTCGTDATGTTSFTLSDGSNTETIEDSDTLTLAAGNDIDVTVGATDTATIALESTIDSVSTINLAGTGTLNGLDAVDATTENTIEALIFDSDAENIAGVWEVQDDTNFVFGNDANIALLYNETDDLFNANTALTASQNTDYAIFTFAADSANSGATANQEIFEVGKGGNDDSDTNYVELFSVDEDGDVVATGTITGSDFTCTDCLDFAELEDTLDLDAALTLNQGTNTWTQNFTGTTTDGLTYNTNSLTTGDAVVISSTSSAAAITSGELLNIDLTSSGEDIASKTGTLASITSDRTHTSGAGTVSDNFDLLSLTRTSTLDGGSAYNTTGSVLRVENSSAAVDVDTVVPLKIIQDAGSTGDAVFIDSNQTTTGDALQIDHEGTGLALNIDDAGNADVVDVMAENTGFSNDILNIQTNEEDTGTFNFLKLISDVDGTPDTELTINQDGDIVTDGAITAADVATFNGNAVIGNANTDTLTINAGSSGAGITFADSSFASCTALETSSGVLTCGSDAGGMTSFTLSDGSNTETIADGNTLLVAAGNDIDTTVSGTDTVTIALESTIDSVAIINLSGTGTINGLDVIDGTTETTLEGAIDIAGEVTGTGLGSVVISCTDCINATEIEDLYLFNNGDVGTGVYDFGGATSFEITNGTGPTVDAAGEIAIDTNSDNTNITHGTPIFYDGTSVRYIPSVSSLPTSDDYVLAYDSTGKQFVFQAQSGGGGSTTLTQAYDSDADGSNATIALTTADDSVVISNPSSSGTDSSFAFQVDQNATGAVAGISIDDEGTGLALDIDDAGNADVIDVIAENTGFSNDIINVQSNEEDTGTFNFLKLISDADGTPDTELTINQDGDITTDGVISATGITSTGVVDFGGATSTEITNGTAPTVDATGEIAIDSTDGQVKYFDGTAARTLTYKKQFSTTLESPSDSDNFNLLKAPYALTITSIQCVVDPADSSESAVITVQERDGNGDSPAGVDGATAITCANTNTADDGSLSNGTIDSGDWVSLDIGTVTGTVTQLTVTVNYTVDGV